MAEDKSQGLSNHTRLDPPFHFFIAPIFLFALIWSVVHLVRHPGWHAGGLVVVAAGALALVFKVRLYSLRVQDRVIRLEERLRLISLLPESSRSRIGELTEGQLIALRFASDAEAPQLAIRAMDEKLPRAEIKKLIKQWRPDNWRV